LGIHIISKSGQLVEYQKVPVSKEEEIEDFIEHHPEILEKEMFVIGRQVETAEKTRIDLLGLDKEGNLIIMELKKDKSPRDVVSQLLEYAVWAENIQYEDLNRIASSKHLEGYENLWKKYEKDFGSVPDYFNEKQRLYIVSEKIDRKTEQVTRYLRRQGVDISCIELNFYENEGQKLADTRIIVGTEKIFTEQLNKEEKGKKPPWNEILENASNENRENVEELIQKIKDKFDCVGKPYASWYYLYTKEPTEFKNQFAAIMCGKNTANVAIRIDPNTFDLKHENIRIVGGWFFRGGGERRISINRANYDLILQSLEHSFKLVTT